jgi:hypothetical protein
MRLRNINTAVGLLQSLTFLNFQCTFLLKGTQLHSVQGIYVNLKSQFLTKLSNCHGNRVTGNVERVLQSVKSDSADTEKV